MADLSGSQSGFGFGFGIDENEGPVDGGCRTGGVGDCPCVGIGNLDRACNSATCQNNNISTAIGNVLTKHHVDTNTTEPGHSALLASFGPAPVPRNGASDFGARQQQSQRMDDAHPTGLRRPSQTCPSSPVASSAPHHMDQRQCQQRQRARLRQGSLASDWRFPSMSSPSTSSPPPQAPRSQTLPPLHQGSTGSGRGAEGEAAHTTSSPCIHQSATSSPRQGRGTALDFDFQRNADPLVHHRLISSDPVCNTRTPLWPKDSSPPNHANGEPTLLCLSPTTTSSQHCQFFASYPARDLPQTVHDQPAHFVNDPVYQSAPFVDCDRDPLNPNKSRAADHSRAFEFGQQSHNALPQLDARFDRELLPITPVSATGARPRWDLLSPRDRNNSVQQVINDLEATTSVDAPLSSDQGFPPSPTRTPKSPTFSTGLFSHPYIPEDEPLDLHFESQNTRYEQAGPVNTAGHAERMHRPDSRMSGDTAYSADNYNFSRPRKPSLRSLNPADFSNNMPTRPGTAKSTASDSLRLESRSVTSSPFNMPTNMPHMPYNSSGPRRQPSVASNMSSATYNSVAPSLRHQGSLDQFRSHHNVSQHAAAGNVVGPPHSVRPQAPLIHFSRGGPLAQNQQSHLYEDELRSSVKSHLTTSTVHSSLFTDPERSSVMTKTSSVFSPSFRNTRQSSFFGPHTPVVDVRDSLSVDDVMGMYENGFNDSEMDLARHLSGIDMSDRSSAMHLNANRMNDFDESRPGTAMSHNSDAANRLLEAMRETRPMSIPGRSFPLLGESPDARSDTKAFFRKSLSRSIPKDMRLSYISTKSVVDGVYGYGEDKETMSLETDSARHSRHDSGKMVDPGSEENSPIEDPEKLEITLLAADVPIAPATDSLSPPPPMHPQPTHSQNIQGALQPEDLDPDANDRYGFRKQNQYVTRQLYDEWNGPYTEYVVRRRRKWEMFLKENGLMTENPNRFPQHSAKAKRFVRKGIPPEWRGAAWFYYAGGPKILANNRGVYDRLLKSVADGNLKEVCREDIERDLYRTFPDNVRFKRGATPAAPGQAPAATPAHSRNNSTQSANPLPKAPGSEPVIIEQLRRVLSAFAIFNPNIGYCQSLNFLGGMLLLFVETEEQAFWLLNIVTRVYLPGTHEMNLEGSKVDLSVLMAELQTTLPSVWTKISDDGYTVPAPKKKPRRRQRGAAPPAADNLPPVTLALTAWFMSCFIGTLPTETTLRVWDVFFYEGSKTLFRVALAIFKAGENEIKAISDPMEVFAVVQTLPRKMLDANLLMETCFKRRSGLGHITSEEIDRSRNESREKLHDEQREKLAAAQAGPPGLQPSATMTMRRQPSDMLSVKSSDGSQRHRLFGRRTHTGPKERSGSDV